MAKPEEQRYRPVAPPAARSSYACRPACWQDVDEATWSSWVWQQQHRIRTLAQLEAVMTVSARERVAIAATASAFRMGITPHYVALMARDDERCPLRRQAVPQLEETLVFPFEMADPLAEEAHMPVAGITHRYPDRVLFYVTHHCPMYCRHCTRKRKVSMPESAPRRDVIEEGLAYIEAHEEVRDVLVSGGDPLSLSNARLGEILRRLRRIEHVDVIRVGTRNPVTLPQRIDEGLCELLAEVSPVFVNTHFNHPAEVSEEAARALRGLREAGCSLGNQMVLLAGVNDEGPVVEALNRWLLRQGCRPYYIFQADMAEGITHFRTRLSKGMALMRYLRGRVSGLGVPQFVVDLPGGGGKVPLVPEYVEGREGEVWYFRSWRGSRHALVDVDGAAEVRKQRIRGEESCEDDV